MLGWRAYERQSLLVLRQNSTQFVFQHQRTTRASEVARASSEWPASLAPTLKTAPPEPSLREAPSQLVNSPMAAARGHVVGY